MAYSWSEEMVPAGTSLIPVNIEYLDKSYIHVYIDDILLGSDNYSWNSDVLIQLNQPLSATSKVSLVRRTDKTQLYIMFAEGAAFIKENLDTQNTQFLHLVQELVEGRSIDGFYGDISMNGYRITNLGDGVGPGDAVNKGQLDEIDQRVSNIEGSFVTSTTSYPFFELVQTTKDTFSPPFVFDKAAVYINGLCQVPGYSYVVVDNQILLAEPVPAGTAFLARLGEDVTDEDGYATVQQLLNLADLFKDDADRAEAAADRADVSAEQVADAVALRGEISDPDGAEKYPELQMARWRDDGDVRGWGAVGDGVTDDTAAINAAAAATTSLYLPEGDFLYKGSVITRDRFLTIRGAGLASTRILYRPDVAGVLFDHTHSPELRGVMTVSDLTVLTDLPAAGTAFKVTAILTSAPHQVNGQHDAIILNRVHVKQTGAGYWTHFLHAVNSGGNHLMLTSFDNSTIVAQADVSVIGVLLEATDARVSMIRTLSATDFYILRTSVAIKTISAGANPVESFYLHTGEIVGVGKAAFQHVGGIGAVMITGVHCDVIEKVIDASGGLVLGARYAACDFGCGTNGAASSPSEMFAFDYGEMVAFSACTITGIGSENSNPLRYVFSFSNTINGTGLHRFAVDGCVFRNFHHVYGLTTGVQNGVASGNVYAGIYDTICADSFGDTSIVLRDAYVCQTKNLVLTATASQPVSFPIPTKWYPNQLPFAQLIQSSPSGSDNLTVEYSFDTSDNTTAKFFIKGCTAARTVRFAFIASALGQSASS